VKNQLKNKPIPSHFPTSLSSFRVRPSLDVLAPKLLLKSTLHAEVTSRLLSECPCNEFSRAVTQESTVLIEHLGGFDLVMLFAFADRFLTHQAHEVSLSTMIMIMANDSRHCSPKAMIANCSLRFHRAE